VDQKLRKAKELRRSKKPRRPKKPVIVFVGRDTNEFSPR
jgi:hypothetical protein